MAIEVEDRRWVADARPSAPAAAAAAAPAALLAAAALAACGGGGGDSGSDDDSAPPPSGGSTVPTSAEASRFLAQASMGADRAQIARVQAIGYAAWLDEQ